MSPALFEQVLGRAPTAAEWEHVARIQAAAGLHENDAFLLVLMTMEHYSTLSASHASRMATEATRLVQLAREAAAKAAQEESARAQATLTRQVVETSRAIALAERPLRWDLIGLTLAFLVLFGAYCAAGGATLANGRPPPWSHANSLFSTLLAMPAGWIMLAPLLPALWTMVVKGWELADETGASKSQRATGWVVIGVAVLFAVFAVCWMWAMV